MDKKQFFSGLAIGFLLPALTVAIFALVLGDGDFSAGLRSLVAREQIGNAIRIGVLANCAVFTIAISKGRDKLSQGLVVSTLLSFIYTLI